MPPERRTTLDLLDDCDFPDGHLHLGVSGGADSVAMGLLARAAGRSFTVWHVDHGHRPTSGDDAAFVADLAERWGVPFELRELHMTPPVPNFEAAARARRYDALPDDVCVAHTASDRAETVLMNLFRGAGLAGVAARMRSVNRPLLALTRWDTGNVCDEAGITPVHDESNDDEVRTYRARVRNTLYPAIARSISGDLTTLLNRHADLLADAYEVIEAAAVELDPTDVAALRTAPRAVATEALRRWIQRESGDPYPVDFASIDRVLGVVDGHRRAAETLGGHRIARSQGRLSFSLASPHGQART
ncbi:MAG: tRNA lysidine(34) synthetase TilS [Actinomycetota bacterium]